MNETQNPKHILLSSVGVSGPKETRYRYQGREETASFSAFGLLKLLADEQRPHEVWFLLTPLARDTCWESIQAESAQLGIPVLPIDLTGDADGWAAGRGAVKSSGRPGGASRVCTSVT